MDKAMGEVSLGAVLGQIFGLSRRFQVEIQPQFTLLQKTMVMAEGVGRQLNPDANMWPLARELADEWMTEQGSIASRLSEVGDRILAAGLRLPELMDTAQSALDRMARPEPPQRAPRQYVPLITGFLAGLIIMGIVFIIIHNM